MGQYKINTVIGGDYQNCRVRTSSALNGAICIETPADEDILLTHDTVERYEVLDETNRKSAASAITRAAVGSFFLGPVGLAAGLTAKSKGQHTVTVDFKDGKRSMLLLDNKLYKSLIANIF